MPKITFVAFDGAKNDAEVPVGHNVMAAAKNNNIDGILGECGGYCSCATCHVYVDEAWLAKLPPMSEQEDEMLDGTAAERRTTSRLSCQINITPELDGLVVHTPEIQSI